MADEARSRLGRGLASLIGDVGGEAAHLERPRAQRKVPIEFLKANPRNPRRDFSEAELGELADSIKQHGVIQPIVVRAVKGTADRYEIIAGERRWRASQIAGLHEVPIVPVDVSDSDALEIAIVENVQRENLNAMEEAQGYHALVNEFKRSQEEIAKVVGKSRSHVANTLRLAVLPPGVQAHLMAGRLSAGHARAIATATDPEALAELIVSKGLSVREAEALAKGAADRPKKASGPRRAPKDADTHALEADLEDVLGMAVEILDRGGAGELKIKYATLEQLDELCRRLTRT
jgi:ParB family transcriptional regulator, chromosome partitioning protein